jgi:hypothetical protein
MGFFDCVGFRCAEASFAQNDRKKYIDPSTPKSRRLKDDKIDPSAPKTRLRMTRNVALAKR